ncbi:Uncharacterised protein [Legionella steigerwaltii]|uniref:Uncharacterized protein n=1 Tax=Legionella steigerwaltii TaxID=460 RepID=A0A378LCS7_9GAMM|nr:hypothetical protein [Legionella steigerwaltii]KTD79076.1 hypothetical protein Lstg_1033 [Legionella steigerwaltii]STY23668.1 Uncharacterised protein [Legionella steigerwaltii]
MPKKKSFTIPKEFVEQVLTIIANESEEGRRKIVAIARRAEQKYELPVKSKLTGWFYQFTRTRGEKVEQSINVMENFPDAYTRLQEFKLMITEGEWNIGSSYNYFLFLELIDAIPDYQPVEPHLMPTFVMQLKSDILVEINSYMALCRASLEEKKAREIEQQIARERARLLVERIMVFNNLDDAKKCQSEQQDKIVFSLSYTNEQWHLYWVDVTDQVHPLNLSEELAQKLSTVEDKDVKNLNSVHLKQIKRECLKAKDQYVAKIQVHINPENTNTHTELSNDDLIKKGITSAFVLRNKEKVTSLWWINSIGVPREISLTDYPTLSSWLDAHQGQGPFNEADLLQLKTYLLQLNTTQLNTPQLIATAKLDKMNDLLSKVLRKKDAQEQPTVAETHKEEVKDKVPQINLKKFAFLEKHLQARKEKIDQKPSSTEKAALESSPKQEVEEVKPEKKYNKLGQNRYSALSELPTFWQNRKSAMEESMGNEIKPLGQP